ncbi:hypothetical protein E3N88_11930 [Mikania micrantha]|uniref:Reverse transcriptase Ty1/copia-type domain-containing protein n=1 Tax=Mikania micrantha TaxID=192012 RepID=A0A5N6P5V3_9ASTR|nr:hypothetical protein E3N88_11930 [Mikania micrantha]
MVGADHAGYTDGFCELEKLVPHLATLETERIDHYIYGLAPEIRGMKSEKKAKVIRNFATIVQEPKKQYGGNLTKCDKCKFHHQGQCFTCTICPKLGPTAKFCRNNNQGQAKQKVCFECVITEHNVSSSNASTSTLRAGSDYLHGIEALNGNNFSTWLEQVKLTLGFMDLDYSPRHDVPPPLDTDFTVEQKKDLVEEQFKGTSKTNAGILILRMLTTKYSGTGGVREHIMMMNDMANQLKTLDMEISEGFLVHFIMKSLPS